MSEPASWPFFPAWELRCKCNFVDCDKHAMQPEYMARLVALRRAFNRAMPLNSAYRCARYNRAVSTTSLTGPHVTGRATDTRLSGPGVYDFVKLALRYGFTGIGIAQKGPYARRFVHLDDLSGDVPDPVTGIVYPRPIIWSY